MSQPTIFVSSNKCDIIMVDFIEITQLAWINWYSNASTGVELFAVLKTGTTINTLATQITNYDIYGDMYFVKLQRGKLVSIDYSDIPGLIDILMTNMSMADNVSSKTKQVDPKSNDCEYYDPESVWDDGWNDGWKTPPNEY